MVLAYLPGQPEEQVWVQRNDSVLGLVERYALLNSLRFCAKLNLWLKMLRLYLLHLSSTRVPRTGSVLSAARLPGSTLQTALSVLLSEHTLHLITFRGTLPSM